MVGARSTYLVRLTNSPEYNDITVDRSFVYRRRVVAAAVIVTDNVIPIKPQKKSFSLEKTRLLDFIRYPSY